MRSIVLLPLLVTALQAQTPPDLERERADFADWMATAPNSPLAARVVIPLGQGIRIGPADSDVPIAGVDARVFERSGSIFLNLPSGERPLPRYRPVTSGDFTVTAFGDPGRSVLVVFGGPRRTKTAFYYPYNAGAVFSGPMQATTPKLIRILSLEGLEVDATEVGTVTVPDGERSIRLRVYRIPTPGTEESELMIFFRDGTSDRGTYPAGRFVSLIPLAGGRYRLDMNRARNPFCAYNSTYPCPAPWAGNTFSSAIEAGEKYQRAAGSGSE